MSPGVSSGLLGKYSQVFPAGSAGIHKPDILSKRRRAHLEALDGVAIFSGVEREPGAEHLWVMNGLRIYQEPAMMFLTGINQPNVILVLNPKRSPHEVLFLPKKDPKKEFWDGVRFGYPIEMPQGEADLDEARRLTGIVDIRPLEKFDAFFQALVHKAPKAPYYGFYHQYSTVEKGKQKTLATRTDANWAFKMRLEKLAKRMGSKDFQLKTCAPLHFRLRLPLEKEQVKDAEIATRHTEEAFRETLPRISELKTENELAALLEYHMRRRNHYGLSFPSIVASGRNATILHYLKNDEPLDRKGLVLMDFGVRYGTMHADISRTVPVLGRFNPLQRLLYEIVLETQELCQKHARPGETIRNLNRIVWHSIESKLKDRFLDKGGIAKRAYTVQPHGVSHLMGEQEHDGDPHRLYQDHPLQPGWQISNEPGIYGHFSWKQDGKTHSEWIGIRIEDNLLITSEGCLNLSRSIPKQPDELEGLMSPSDN